MYYFKYLIPIVAAILYRLGGWDKGNKWFRWIGIGLFIAFVYQSWWFVLTYFIATNVFSYGEKHPLTQLFGDFNWFISGFMFGLASFSWGNAVWSGCVMYILMHLSNEGIRLKGCWWYEADPFITHAAHDSEVFLLDHKWVEICIGFFGTLFYLFA